MGVEAGPLQGVDLASKADELRRAGHELVDRMADYLATLESRGQHGRFTLADLNGETTVEAGTVVGEGVGVVRAGPDLKGATGAMAGGLVVPRAILGRK